MSIYIFLGIGIFTFISTLLIIFLPKFQLKESQLSSLDEKTLENELRRTLIQYIGGVFLIIGILSSWYTYELNKERDFASQIKEVIVLLDDDKDYKKIAAVYSLKQIVTNHKNNSYIVLDLLTAYIKDKGKIEENNYIYKNIELKQAILRVLSLLADEYDYSIDLSELDFRKLSLDRIKLKNMSLIETDFRFSNLSSADFSNSIISGSDFREADLINSSFIDADLRYADLRKANIKNADFSGADLRGIDGYLEDEIKKFAKTNSNTKF